MRPYFCTRFYRRCIVKYFGGTKNLFLWLLALMLTMYLLDGFLFGSSHSSSTDVKSLQDSGAPKNKDESSDASRKPLVRCSEVASCPDGQISYYLKAGAGRDDQPTICVNGQYAFSPDKKNGNRGICMAVFSSKTLDLEDARTFDTYTEDRVFNRYIRLGMEDRQLVAIATVDDASFSLAAETKEYMQNFGSAAIMTLAFRDSWVMIGQRGLEKGKAIEQVKVRPDTSEYPTAAEMKGCVSIPMGGLRDLPKANPGGPSGSKLPLGEEVANCGMKDPCPSDTFSLRLFSGTENKEGPRICFNGRVVMSSELNNGGRGINLVIVDPERKEALEAYRYDTYEVIADNAALVARLKTVPSNHMILAVAHDDAVTSITEDVRAALATFGSAYISTLAFRDVWGFVGRPALSGYTPYEDMELGGQDVWPVPVDRKFCVAQNFKGSDKKSDVSNSKNMNRRTFCRKFDGYEDFCSAAHIDKYPTPTPLNDSSIKAHPIFNVPIMIVPGLGHVATLQQFDALMQIPGLNTEMVTVLFDQKFEESGLLAKLYNFPTVELTSSTKYVLLFEKALDQIWSRYPKAEHVIAFEEEAIPTKDFLHFMAQCWAVVNQDPTLVGISAWNENGFENVSSLSDVVYRGRMFPGLGFLIKKSFYLEHLKGNMSSCCYKRSWYGWFAKLPSALEMIFPDVSRVLRRQFLGLTENAELIQQYFNRPRVVSSGNSVVIKNPEVLLSAAYEAELAKLIYSSVPLTTENVQDCLSGKGLGFYVPDVKEKSFSVYFMQRRENDDTLLSLLCKCFRLFSANTHLVRGKHKDMMRFSYKGNQVFLVGSMSPYFKYMPASYRPVVQI